MSLIPNRRRSSALITFGDFQMTIFIFSPPLIPSDTADPARDQKKSNQKQQHTDGKYSNDDKRKSQKKCAQSQKAPFVAAHRDSSSPAYGRDSTS